MAHIRSDRAFTSLKATDKGLRNNKNTEVNFLLSYVYSPSGFRLLETHERSRAYQALTR